MMLNIVAFVLIMQSYVQRVLSGNAQIVPGSETEFYYLPGETLEIQVNVTGSMEPTDYSLVSREGLVDSNDYDTDYTYNPNQARGTVLLTFHSVEPNEYTLTISYEHRSRIFFTFLIKQATSRGLKEETSGEGLFSWKSAFLISIPIGLSCFLLLSLRKDTAHSLKESGRVFRTQDSDATKAEEEMAVEVSIYEDAVSFVHEEGSHHTNSAHSVERDEVDEFVAITYHNSLDVTDGSIHYQVSMRNLPSIS